MSNPETDKIIGVDLGTTNSVISTATFQGDEAKIDLLQIEQIAGPGSTNKLDRLPSFLFHPLANESAEGEPFALDWNDGKSWVAGEWARERGADVPNRFVSSSKSWLCLPGTDRRKPILPPDSAEDIEKISPYDASVFYLKHLAGALQKQAKAGVGEHDAVLTVPASFDEEARQLTLQAAREAGFENLTMLEEPQAAIYAWLFDCGEEWRDKVEKGDTILVCDVGGGTSDFSLVRVVDRDGNMELERVAVGEHILLGGDNMDLALAYQARKRLQDQGKKINASQLRSLWFQARRMKEDLLGGAERSQVTLLGSGSKLIGGTLKAEFNRDEVVSLLVDGFFPRCSMEDMPKEPDRAGLHEVGLPYAADAAVTRHLAKFISRQMSRDDVSWPTHILFNGGVFRSEILRERCVEVINSWLEDAGRSPIVQLGHGSLDSAVAKGAAYYGLSRQGKGIRIRAGISRGHYIEVESSLPAVPGMEAPSRAICIAPFGMEEGSECTLNRETFALRVGQSAKFRFLSTTLRPEDSPGDSVEDPGDEFESSREMTVELPAEEGMDSPVPVKLGAKVTEVGTLELFFRHVESGREWKLEYGVREEQ